MPQCGGETMKRRTIIGIAVLTAALIAGGGYAYYTRSAANEAAKDVPTVVAERMNIKSTVEATGTIRPVDSVEVSSKITARISSVLVKENDTVTAGQIVATLDGKDYEAKRDQAQYRVTNTRAKYNRMSYLESIGAKSKSDLEDAEYNYDTAQSTLEEANSDANETIITAPISGVVVGEPKNAGTMAVQGSDNPTVIMRIADLSKKQIKAKVDETDIGNIRIGQSATFSVDAFTDKTFTARVSKISQTDVTNSWDTSSSSSSSAASSASVIYYYVTLDVDDPDNLLLPAMTARVVIDTADKDNALVVPLSVLKTDAAGAYVLVLNDDGTQEQRYVETGIYSDEYVEILSGLSEGERIVNSYTAKKSTSSTKDHGGPPPM